MKKTLIFVCIAVLLLGGGIFGSWYVLTHKQSERIARIYQQDKLLYEIDLSTVQKAYTITIDGENGAENVVLVEPGQISITLQLQVWTKSEDYWPLHYRLLESVKKAFDAKGISIPYPQMDVHLPENTSNSDK